MRRAEPSLLRPIGMLFSGGVLGKLLGLAREVLFAAGFGTSSIAAAYRVAQTTTLIPVNFFLSDSLNAAFLPLHARYRGQDPVRADALFWCVAVSIGGLALAIAALLLTTAPTLVGWIAPGLGMETREAAAAFVRVMALSVPFYVAGGLLSYLEMAHDGYTLASMRASVQNVGLIAGVATAMLTSEMLAIAWGWTLAYVFFSLHAVQRLGRRHLLPRPSVAMRPHLRPVLRRFMLTLLPLLLLPFFLQGSLAAERMVASLIGLEAVSALDYARFITETGILLLAVPMGLLVLSRMGARSAAEIQTQLSWIIPCLLTLTVPCSLFLWMQPRALVEVLYARGSFDAGSVQVTSTILRGLAIGFWAQVCAYVLIKVLNAQLRNRLVVVIMAVSLLAQVLVLLLGYRAGGALVLGLAASVGGFLQLVLCARVLGIAATTASTLVWLALGGLVYASLAPLVSATGWPGFLAAVAVWLLFWSLYVLAVPALRRPVQVLLLRTRG